MSNNVRASMQPDYAVNIFACLDRFSLDSVGFTCPTLKGIVDKHLPVDDEHQLRVLESVTIKWHDGNRQTATLVPESPLGKAMKLRTIDDAVENDAEDAEDYAAEDEDYVWVQNKLRRKAVLHDAAALCANSFVKFFKLDEWVGTFMRAFLKFLPGIRIQRLMVVDTITSGRVMRPARLPIEKSIIQFARGVESLLMKTDGAYIGRQSLQWLKEHGVRRLAVDDDYYLVTEDGVRAFCVGGPETADEAAPERALYLRGANRSFEFLQQLAQECLAADAGRVLTVTFYRYRDFDPPLSEHLAQACHGKDGRRRCLHFRFDAAAGPYEIVAQSRGDRQWKVTLRGGHSAVPHCAKMCRRENWFRELEEISV